MLFSTAATIEVGWVSVQRARGVASHFNDATAADALAFSLAGGVSVGFIAVVLTVLFVLSWRRTAPPALATAIRSGLAILLVSQAVGSQMISRGIASLEDGGPANHAVAPAGDLKVSHAVAMHAIQVLPALALWLDGRHAGLPPGAPRRPPDGCRLRPAGRRHAGYGRVRARRDRPDSLVLNIPFRPTLR